MRVAVIASTNGGVLSKLLEFDYFKSKLELVVSDRECGAIELARKHDIPTCVLHSKTGAEFSDKLLEFFGEREFDLLISFYTKLFRGNFVKTYKNKLINLHPSLLPAFPGMDGFGDTIKSNVCFAGSTIHFVDEGTDTGPPILQSAIPIDPNEDETCLRHRLFIQQCQSLLQVVKWFEQGRVSLKNKKVLIADTAYDKGVFSPSLDFKAAVDLSKELENEKKSSSKEVSSYPASLSNLIDYRNVDSHPLHLTYSELYSAIVLDGDFIHGRSQPGYVMSKTSPFVYAACQAVNYGLEKQDVLEKMTESLKNFYELIQPSSAAQWLGLRNPSNKLLNDAPPWAAVYPWRARTLDSYQKAYEKAALHENIAVGRDIGIEDGWLFCGPVSEEKCLIEASRILFVLRQISKYGYKRDNSPDGDVRATALVGDDNTWRWLITAGNHRASAASALGYKSIPIRVNLVIRRCDFDYWPRVVDGLYTKKEALQIFDSYFSGKPSLIAEPWRKYLNKFRQGER